MTSSSSIGVNILKGFKFGVFTLLLVGVVIALTGIAWADQVVPAVPETQTLGTRTTVDILGLATENDAATWSVTSGGVPLSGTDPVVATWPGWATSPMGSYADYLTATWNIDKDNYPDLHLQDELSYFADHPDYYSPEVSASAGALLAYLQAQGGLHDPPLYDKEVRYTTAYDANIVAQGGHTAFTKTMNIDTRNKVVGQSNLEAQTGLAFAATDDGGNVVGSENLLIDGVGNPTNASDRMLCPFSAANGNVIPAFCNIVQAGSRYDLTIGSVTTGASDRFVGTDATNPVVLNSGIDVKPYGTTQGQIAASGSVMAYIKAHIQEAGNASTVLEPTGLDPVAITMPSNRTEDLVYNEQSSAQGTISSFSKVIAYQSGKALL